MPSSLNYLVKSTHYPAVRYTLQSLQKNKMDSERDVHTQILTVCPKLLIENEGNIIWKHACCLLSMEKLVIVYRDRFYFIF